MLHWNFTSQNRRKIWPKMRPEVVICDFSYHRTLIMLHTCFQCVLLNEAVLSSHSLRYSRIIVHFYVRSNLTGLHFGAKKAKNHVLWNLQHWKLFQLVRMWFICIVLIDIYHLVPKVRLTHVALEFYKPKQTKNLAKNEARGSYLRF